MNKILVIIPVHNLYERYTKQCVASIYANEVLVPLEVMIVDNASSDVTAEKMKEDFPKLIVHRNHKNAGCAGGWNTGLKYGLENGYTHFFLPNNDTLIHPKAINALYERINRGDIGLAACVDASGEVKVPSEVLKLADKAPSEAPNPNFSAFMITKDTFNRVGYFDEEYYPAYHEDNSYHHRIKLIYGPMGAITITTAVFYHYGSRTQNESESTPIVPGPLFERTRQTFISMWGGIPGHEKFTHPYNDPTLSPVKLSSPLRFDKIG